MLISYVSSLPLLKYTIGLAEKIANIRYTTCVSVFRIYQQNVGTGISSKMTTAFVNCWIEKCFVLSLYFIYLFLNH